MQGRRRLYGRQGKCRTTFVAMVRRHTIHFALPLFWPSNDNFPISLILGLVSRRNEIMFTVSLSWHYLQNNIVQRRFLK